MASWFSHKKVVMFHSFLYVSWPKVVIFSAKTFLNEAFFFPMDCHDVGVGAAGPWEGLEEMLAPTPTPVACFPQLSHSLRLRYAPQAPVPWHMKLWRMGVYVCFLYFYVFFSNVFLDGLTCLTVEPWFSSSLIVLDVAFRLFMMVYVRF